MSFLSQEVFEVSAFHFFNEPPVGYYKTLEDRSSPG